jgi:hypothetical protein
VSAAAEKQKEDDAANHRHDEYQRYEKGEGNPLHAAIVTVYR